MASLKNCLSNCFTNQFASSSPVDYSGKQNQAEEIIYLNYKIRWNTTPMWLNMGEHDFYIISSCRNLFNNKLKTLLTHFWCFQWVSKENSGVKWVNKQKISFTQQIYSFNLKNPLRKNVKRLSEFSFHLVEYANTKFMS